MLTDTVRRWGLDAECGSREGAGRGRSRCLGRTASVTARANNAEHFHFSHFLLKVSLLRISLSQGKQVLT